MLSWTAVPDAEFIHAVGRDVTAEKEAADRWEVAQERLRQAQRMEALGQLAGGIAHDFNNVLQAVSGGLSLIQRRASTAALRDIPQLAAIRQVAEMAESAAARGAAVTGRLLAFARKDGLLAVAVPARELLQGLQEFLAPTLGSAITIRIESKEGMPSLMADKAQLETVLVNLAINARDAMQDGGVLTVSAVTEMFAGDNAVGLTPGGYVRLSVEDTGSGMDEATLARAGDPFFTTKPPGKGTGLGLAMARGFAQQSGGSFSISSYPGRGTTVSLWFPLASEDESRIVIASNSGSLATATTSGLRVLLVDDEPAVRGVLAAHLEDKGFVVSTAVDGLDGLARLDGGDIPDLLVTDITMPGMNGIALLAEARKRAPWLPVLLLTGYADPSFDIQMQNRTTAPTALLRKPVSGAELASTAWKILEQKKQATG